MKAILRVQLPVVESGCWVKEPRVWFPREIKPNLKVQAQIHNWAFLMTWSRSRKLMSNLSCYLNNQLIWWLFSQEVNCGLGTVCWLDTAESLKLKLASGYEWGECELALWAVMKTQKALYKNQSIYHIPSNPHHSGPEPEVKLTPNWLNL